MVVINSGHIGHTSYTGANILGYHFCETGLKTQTTVL